MAGGPALRLIGPLLLLLVREGAPLLATTHHRPVLHQLHQLASGQRGGAPRLLRMQEEWESDGQPPRKQRRGERAARPGPDYARNQICCYGCGAELQVTSTIHHDAHAHTMAMMHTHTPWPRTCHAPHRPCHAHHATHPMPCTPPCSAPC